MINYKYKMVWNFENDSYESKSQSLENLIVEMINIQENNEAKFIFVDRKENDETGDTFHIHFVVSGETYEYDCGANAKNVAEFLESYINEWGYEDTIEIQTI